MVSVSPQRVALKGAIGAPLSADVKIVGNPDKPIKIKAVKPLTGEHIKARLNPQSTAEKKAVTYTVTIENLKKAKGRYFDSVIIKTDNKLKPEIRIPVFGNIVEE